MSNRKKKRYSTIQPNLYSLGDEIKAAWNGASTPDKISGIGNLTSGIIGGVSGGVETGAGNIMSGVGNIMSVIPGIGGAIGAGVGALGQVVNALFGSKLNNEFIAQTENNVENKTNYRPTATDNSSFLDEFGDASILGYVSKNQVGRDGLFSNKASRKTRALNAQIDDANEAMFRALQNRAATLDAQNDLNIAANFSGLGGYLLRHGGGIHINKENKGKFTSYCGGKVTDECIRKGLHSSNPLTRKRANFARNARKWHAFGGELGTNGTDWTNGVNYFDVGGTHEENPYQGIPQGIDENGIPNLVEEGEVRFEDYIFSNRLKADKEAIDLVGLPSSSKGKTYAKLAKKASRESIERPNDPISIRGLTDTMTKLQIAQELQKVKDKTKEFSKGGNLFEEGGKKSTWMRYAPAAGGALGALATAFTPIDEPNYSDANSILGSVRTVGYTPITERLTYKPFDRNYYSNQLNAQSGATRRALANAAGGNRATLIAALTGADYNAQNQMGNLFRQAEEYNQAQRERVQSFNRGTSQANSQMSMQAQQANAELSMRAAQDAAKLRQAELQRYRGDRASQREAIAANLTNFIESLGGIGQENYYHNQLVNMAENGVLAAMPDGRGGFTFVPRVQTQAKGGKIKKSKRNKLKISI